MAKKKQNKKDKTGKYIQIIILIVILVIAGFALYLTMTKERICKDKTFEQAKDNCSCVERENKYCTNGYVLQGGLCKQGTNITNAMLGCSKYKCGDCFVNLE